MNLNGRLGNAFATFMIHRAYAMALGSTFYRFNK
jgi:hypothetical protein